MHLRSYNFGPVRHSTHTFPAIDGSNLYCIFVNASIWLEGLAIFWRAQSHLRTSEIERSGRTSFHLTLWH